MNILQKHQGVAVNCQDIDTLESIHKHNTVFHWLPIVLTTIMEENCSNNMSSECDTGYYLYLEIMYIHILSVLLAFGIFGDSLSVIVFIKQRRKKTSPNTTAMLICLAAADNLFLATSIFSRLLPTLSTYVFLGQKLSWSIHFRP